MYFKISRENYFSEFIYKMDSKGSWKLTAFGRFKRTMRVKNLVSGEEYKLQRESLFNSNLFYHDSNEDISQATNYLPLILNYLASLASTILPQLFSIKTSIPSRSLSENSISTLYIEDAVYEIFKQSALVFSIVKNGKPVAVCKRESKVVLGLLKYEICYSKFMEENEHILLLMFLYFDNTINRGITAFQGECYVLEKTFGGKDVAEMEYNTSSQEHIASWNQFP